MLSNKLVFANVIKPYVLSSKASFLMSERTHVVFTVEQGSKN